MSYIANTAFEPRIVNNRFDDLANIAGLYGAYDENIGVFNTADCSAGWLCVQYEQVPCEGFPGILNENTWYMTNAGEGDATVNIDTPIYACNTYDTKLIGDGRNNWHVGLETLGLGAPAGRYCTFTHIDFDGRSVYRFGIGNVDGLIGNNKYFTISYGMLIPTAAAPTAAGSIYFELRGTGNFTEGTTSSFQYVDVVAKRVSVAA